MTIERLVALNINDQEKYQQYRDAMAPILADHQGSFGYDFVIEKVLKNETSHDINRVFTLRFDSEKNLQDFFSNEQYLAIKTKYFHPSVADVTQIAKYTKNL